MVKFSKNIKKNFFYGLNFFTEKKSAKKVGSVKTGIKKYHVDGQRKVESGGKTGTN